MFERGITDDILINAKLNAWGNSETDFLPRSAVDGRDNHKTTIIVYPDGTVKAVVRLLADGDREREGFIIHNYLRFYAKFVASDSIGIDFVGRDEPWDASIQVNKSQQFELEITALAEDENSYATLAKDQNYKGLAKKETISAVELQRVRKWFKDFDKSARTEVLNGSGNPITQTEKMLTLSLVNAPEKTWLDMIYDLVKKKAQKHHPRKASTVIVIDNQAILLSKMELLKGAAELGDRLSDFPFPEIFFYTGFFGREDGMSASFSLVPLKISKDMKDSLRRSRLATGQIGDVLGEYFIDDPA